MRAVLIIAVVSVFLAGCATNPLSTARFWRLEQCAGMGNPNVRFQRTDGSELARVPRANCEHLQNASRKIQAQAAFTVDRVLISDLETVNASAGIDNAGKPVVVINLGMLMAVGSDEDAWAGLLGHEIAHLVRRHRDGREEARASARAGGQVVGNVIAQLIPGIGGFIAGNAANFVTANAMYGAYTRPQEAEADQLGLQWMSAAGYDPRGMARLFRTLGQQAAAPPFLSTHPGADDRAQSAEQFALANPRSAPQPASAPPAVSSVATLHCADVSAETRLKSLCTAADSCKREADSIRRLCTRAGSGACESALQDLMAGCDSASPTGSSESCTAAITRIQSVCVN